MTKVLKAILLHIAVFAAIAAGFAIPGSAQQQQRVFAAMDDQAGPELIKRAGFNTVKKLLYVSPRTNGFNSLDDAYRRQLTAYMDEARNIDLKVVFELYDNNPYQQPTRPNQWRGLCLVAVNLVQMYPGTVTGIEVGVEPNSPTFDKPQYVNGNNVVVKPYLNWLATCYDMIKQVDPSVLVIGGSLASRGKDNPGDDPKFASTSPVTFIRLLCHGYVVSRRGQPIMDWFDMHSYQSSSSEPPWTTHPYPSTTITIADYEKLHKLLSCFDGTAQPEPPVWWGESAYQSRIPAGQLFRYNHAEQATSNPVDEGMQGQFIKESIKMAYCDGSVGFGQLHVLDESDRRGWQSGLYYAATTRRGVQASGGTAKSSAGMVRNTVQAADAGTLPCGQPPSESP
jgi:hypothetical protein